MKTTINLSLTFGASIILFSCTPQAEPIAYGIDNCHHCKMTITDSRYGSEMITKKGKVYKFDAVECLASYINENKKNEEVHQLLVTDYTQPGTLVDVNSAVFLQSRNLPSPMGKFLTAFGGPETALKIQEEKGGNILNWMDARKVSDNNGNH